MDFLRNFFSRLNRRKKQEADDLYRAVYLLSLFPRLSSPPPPGELPAVFDAARVELASLGRRALSGRFDSLVLPQLRQLLSLPPVGVSPRVPARVPALSGRRLELSTRRFDELSAARSARSPRFAAPVRLSHAPSASLSVSASPVGGFGVFLRGWAAPGTLIAMYPGAVWPALALADRALRDGVLRAGENPYLFATYDEHVIDASGYAARAQRGDAACGAPGAVGHLLNHPPRGVQGGANVMGVQWSGDPDGPLGELVEKVPNWRGEWAPEGEPTGEEEEEKGGEGEKRGPPRAGGLMQGWLKHLEAMQQSGRDARVKSTVLFLTTRYVRDEELFLNYRYNPKGKLPDWYHDFEPEESKNRWG